MIQQINERGEMKIGDYWKLALTDPKLGYYINQNVFSKEGDVTTSPEISTLFGEMVATWIAVFMQTPSVGLFDPISGAIKRKFRLI